MRWILGGIAIVVVILAMEDRPPTRPQVGDAAGSGKAPLLTSTGGLQAPVPAPARAPAFVTAYGGGQFKGYGCTGDCSGHEAGYEWAELHDIDDPDDCGEKSDSFIEGCRAYALEQSGDGSSDDSDGDKDEDE